MATHIHEDQPLITRGVALESAQCVLIMVHGRGGGTESILPLINHIHVEGFAYLVPSAKDRTWYPNRFLAPRDSNEPYLTSALSKVRELVDRALTAGISAEKIALLGFSQGACLALEFAARHPRDYGAVIGLSGALIGADHELVGYAGNLSNTNVFLGCSDVDDHIPLQRVHETADIFAELGASVDKRIYPNMAHTVNADEATAVKALLQRML